MSRICITGTHGVGKTTLAAKLSNLTGLPVILEASREIGRVRRHADPDWSIATGADMDFQEACLDYQEYEESCYPDGFIADRGWLDYLAYPMLMGVFAGVEPARLAAYVQRVAKGARDSYDVVVFLMGTSRAAEPDGFRHQNEPLRRAVESLLYTLVLGTHLRCHVVSAYEPLDAIAHRVALREGLVG